MKSVKRVLAGILATILVLSSAQLPGGISYAEELTPVQEGISDEEPAVQEDALQQEPGQEDADEKAGEEKTEPPGAEASEGTSGDSGTPEEDPAQTEKPVGDEEPSDQDAEDPADQLAPDAQLPDDEVSVSENDLQISANDLMSVGAVEVWVDAEMEGVYQFGDAPSADEGIALYSESAYTDDQIMDYLYIQMKERITPIDVSQYEIPFEKRETEEEKKIPTKIQLLVSGALNEHPDLYYVSGRYSYSYSPATEKITELNITYDATLNASVWQQGVDAALASVDQDMTDLQKAIVLHDYLTVNCEYDKENLDKNTVPSVSHSTYGVFANRTAVCDGYALSYKYLLQQVGIDCYMVTSEEINHAWNLIKLDGEYYQVDVTWDDPTWDLVGRSVHTYMFRSDESFDPAGAPQKHSGGRVTYGSQTVDYQATDTRYDDAFWTDCTSPMVLSGSECYYISSDGGAGGNPALMKASLGAVTSDGAPLQQIDKWPVWLNSGGIWPGVYSGLFRIDDRLYFNDKANIYSTAMDGTDKKTEFVANTENGYIYGSAYYGGAVRYSIHQSPNLTEKEKVLTADLGEGGTEPAPLPESGVALELENLYCQYTALDGTQISSTAEGKPKLLVFYSNSCANCQNTILDISSEIDKFSGIDIYALESDGGTEEAVARMKDQYGCEEITFSYDTTTKNMNSMWAYLRVAGIEDATVAMPVLCYIDGNNRLQYITRGLKTADEVRANLEKYCNYSQAYTITYILGGGTNNSENPSVYTEKDTVIILRDPVREGFQFEGWYADAAYSIRVIEIYGENRSDITLYAKWKPLTETETPTIDLTPAEGNVLMGFSGAYYTETADKILNRLNEIRLEACREGVRKPGTDVPLTIEDYVPLQWSSDLEAIARLRAAEATVKQAHERPNGQRCFTVVTKNGEQSWAENLAWNYNGLMKGIEQWYGEKNDWVNQTGAVTGHYTSIINPGYCAVGVGAFRLSSGGWYAVAQEFSYKDGMDAKKDASSGECVQYMEVQGENVSNLSFSGTQTAFLQEGDTCRFSVNVTVQYNDYYNNAKSFTGPYQAGGKWTTSDEKVAVVDSTGEVRAVGKGTAQISVSAGSQSASAPITVYGDDESPVAVKAPDSTTYKVGGKINLKGGTVTYPSGDTLKTDALTENMINGFDSSKPGICEIRVSVGGYTAGFDTLIVEEPKLTASVGQRLSEIALPQNEHGTYTWQDDTQTVEKAGIYTFVAVFTPKDETKFQKLSDIQVQVTAQEMLGDGTDVTFKTNRFTYNGVDQEPKVVVRSADVVLKEGQDYELSYENNRNAGTATVTIEGTGCYLGTIRRTFEIQPAPLRISAKDKTILVGAAIPAGGAYEYGISGLVGTDVLLTEPVFSCAVADTTATGQYEIVPSGADAGANYTITYENGRLTVAYEYVSCTVTFDVQGHGTAPAAQFGLRAGSTAEKPEDPNAAGYRFDGWYRDAACTKAWNFETDIVQADMTLYAKWLEESKEDGGFAFQEIADVYYTGKACKPVVSVYDGNVLLKSGRDYQIKYFNNTNANKGGVLKSGNGEGVNFNSELPYVEIIGKGNYTDRIKDGNKDTVKVNFNILRASIGDGTAEPAAGVTLKVSDQLVTANKVQKPFSSIKYAKGMKRDVDFRLRLTPENARDGLGKSLEKDMELPNAEIPANSEGEFLLTLEGIGNYAGSICRTVYVTDKAHLMKNATVTLGRNQKNVVFTGQAVKLTAAEEDSPDTFTVKYGKIFLKPGRDYVVSYRNHEKVGKAELVITGNGEYVGTKTAAFNITGKSFSAKTVQVSGVEDKQYTGRALTQNDAVLTYLTQDGAEMPLQYGTDYTISYSKNVNRGNATMTFRGVDKAGYSGSFKKTFKIEAVDIADQDQVSRAGTMESMSFQYCKAGVKPVDEIVLTNKAGFILRNGKDYTLAYKNNKAVANASSENPPTVTVKGKGNYNGKFDITFQITKSGLNQAVAEGSIRITPTAVAYNPDKAEDYEYKPAIKLMDGKSALRVNTDYELEYLCNTQADYSAYLRLYEETVKKAESGETDPDSDEKLQELMPRAVITAKADGYYEADGEIIVPLPVYRTKLVKKNLQIEIAEAVYTGNQVTPAATVRDAASGKTLTEGKDYTVSYGANNKSGKNKGSVTITGIAPEYGGSVTVKFEIVRKAIIY
ncbi:MAG: InlB B-repeat-containing protein [Lachnospiraceae bacterium]|nr:InlB B-repeat-containing protein [Lachnospiraceae bacterium]